MIVIEDVKWFETDRDPHELIIYNPYDEVHVRGKFGDESREAEVISELLRGRRFRRPHDKKEIVIASSEIVQKLIGIQYSCLDAMEDEIAQQSVLTGIFQKESLRLKSAPFWLRFKWLFTGVGK